MSPQYEHQLVSYALISPKAKRERYFAFQMQKMLVVPELLLISRVFIMKFISVIFNERAGIISLTLRDAEVAKSRGTCTPTPDEADMDDGKAEVYLSCYFSSALRLPGLVFFLPQSHHGSSALARQSLSLFARPNKTAMLRRLWSSSLKNWTPLSTSKSLSNEYVSRKLLVPYSG